MKLACKIIEDLLPLYCDDACTDETRALVEAHLQECDSCRALHDKIREELNIPCRLIEDLLPLYHDSACSNETRALVDMHLNSCKICRAKLEEIGVELLPKPDSMKPLKKLRLQWIRTRKKAILRGTIAGMLCVALGWGAWYGLTRWYCIPVSAADIQITNLCETKDGSIAFHLDILGLDYLNDMDIEYAGETVYLTPKRAALDVFTGYHGFSNNTFYFCSLKPEVLHNYPYAYWGYDEYGNCIDYNGNIIEEPGIPDYYFPDYIKTICIGTSEDFEVIWQEGMDLPPADAAIENFYRNNYK